MTEQTPDPPIVQITLDIVQGLDGSLWPRAQFIAGLTSYVLAMPLASWKIVVDQLATGLDRAQEDIRAAPMADGGSGPTIIRADADDLARISRGPNRAARRANGRRS